MRTIPWQLATLCALTLLTACGQQEAGDNNKGLSENKEAGSVITRNNTAEPQSLDPHQITGIPEINIIRDLFDGLVQTDEKGEIQPALAQSWESKDNKVWRFRLRDDANPNGSVENIAGVCNAGRNVFGMMPHPERAADERLGNTDGKALFRSLLQGVPA